MGRIGDKRTPEEVQAALEASRAKKMEAAVALVYDLADAGFDNLWIEYNQITSHGDAFVAIVMDEVDLGSERFDEAITIARANGALPHISEVRMNQTSFSRLAFWIREDED